MLLGVCEYLFSEFVFMRVYLDRSLSFKGLFIN